MFQITDSPRIKKTFVHKEHKRSGKIIEELIWGGQDGLVNVLGLVLGVAAATNDSKIVLIAGITAAFAESISMAAVAYTSQKAAKQYYESERRKELKEIREVPEMEKQEIREILAKKGFKGKELERAVQIITSNKHVWLDVMMKEELNLGSYKEKNPKKAAMVVGLSAVVGAVFPLVPFVLADAKTGIILSLLVSLAVLFTAGAVKARFTVGDWKKNGLEMAAIGTLAAVAGYAIGILLQGILG